MLKRESYIHFPFLLLVVKILWAGSLGVILVGLIDSVLLVLILLFSFLVDNDKSFDVLPCLI